MLHNNKELFEQVILKASENMGIDAGIIEKDYFVTLFLKELSSVLPGIIFKGGTSLSKCHKLIKRFSEDIDLNIEFETKATEGQRKSLKKTILSVIEGLELELVNPEAVKSRRDYNRYIVDFPSVFKADGLKQHLLVETAVYIKAYPKEKMYASSLIYDYLSNNGFNDLICEYCLEPFAINVQSASRTFVDKIFALGDYYLDNKIREHSRHIYDLHKLMEVVTIDDDLKELAKLVKEERKVHKQCLSAQDDINMNDLISKIISEDVYKADYETITETLLFEQVKYEDAILTLQKICDVNLF